MLSVSRKVGKSGGFQFGLTTCIKQSQLTDSPGYIECDNFWLIRACGRIQCVTLATSTIVLASTPYNVPGDRFIYSIN